LVDSVLTRNYTLIALFSTALLTVISLPPYAVIFSINVVNNFTVGFFLSAYAIIALIYAALLYSQSHNISSSDFPSSRFSSSEARNESKASKARCGYDGYESKTIKLLLLCFYFVLAYAAVRHVMLSAIVALALFVFVSPALSRLSPLLRAESLLEKTKKRARKEKR